jgi:hypothetical protein
MKRISCLLLAATAAGALAQSPDVAVKLDLAPTYRSSKGADTLFRWYDTLGHYSTAGLLLRLEPGYRAYVSERLQRVNNDADPEQLDEYYVEDPGIWRLGKQYLPFGRQGLLRESVRAARGDTRLLVESVPIAVALCDNGARQARGIVGRIGSVVGVSFAYGNDFGAQASSLTLVRRPEDSPGQGRGYRTALGLDFARHFKIYTIQAEAVFLRRGQTPLDPNTEVSDLAITLQPSRHEAITIGWSREWGQDQNFLRAQGRFLLTRSTWLEPIVRVRDGVFYDLGITLRVRI